MSEVRFGIHVDAIRRVEPVKRGRRDVLIRPPTFPVDPEFTRTGSVDQRAPSSHLVGLDSPEGRSPPPPQSACHLSRGRLNPTPPPPLRDASTGLCGPSDRPPSCMSLSLVSLLAGPAAPCRVSRRSRAARRLPARSRPGGSSASPRSDSEELQRAVDETSFYLFSYFHF